MGQSPGSLGNPWIAAKWRFIDPNMVWYENRFRPIPYFYVQGWGGFSGNNTSFSQLVLSAYEINQLMPTWLMHIRSFGVVTSKPTEEWRGRMEGIFRGWWSHLFRLVSLATIQLVRHSAPWHNGHATNHTNHTHHTHQTLIITYCWCKRLLHLFLVAKHLTHLEVFWSRACRCNSWPSLGFIANHPVTNRLRAKKTKSRLIPQLSTGNLFTIGTNKLKLICWDNCINSSLRANYSIS